MNQNSLYKNYINSYGLMEDPDAPLSCKELTMMALLYKRTNYKTHTAHNYNFAKDTVVTACMEPALYCLHAMALSMLLPGAYESPKDGS